MKHFNLFCRLMLLCIVCSFSIPALSQGVVVYKKDGTMVKYSYAEVDSIVTYNYGEEPGAPVTPPSTSPYEAVDLGLSVKWASCNVGANAPEEYGDYFAWGEISPKSSYDNFNSVTYGKAMSDISGNAQYDAARANWGGKWRMPTLAEINELLNNCSWKWTTQNGVNGYRVTGPNGNSVFVPAAGFRRGTSLNNEGSSGYYWSSTPYESDSLHAYCLFFDSSDYDWGHSSRYNGLCVRPVLE